MKSKAGNNMKSSSGSTVRLVVSALLYVLFFVVAVAVIMADLSLVVEPVSKFMAVPSLMALAYEWLIMALILLAALALLTRRWNMAAIAAVVLVLSAVPISHTVSLWQNKPEHPTERKITVLTYNTQMLARNNRTDKSKPLTDDMLSYIRRQNADIVLLQEFLVFARNKGYSLEEIKNNLGYPYSYIDYKKYSGNRKYGMAVFSKYPLIDKKTIRYESKSNQSDMCLALVGNDTLLIVNNHLESIKLTNDNFDFSQHSSEQLKEKTHTIVSKMLKAYTLRSQQAKVVRREIENSPYKTIVCGDFNDTPVSFTYHALARGMKDAYLEAHPLSLGHSFYHGLLGIRIDYVLCSKSFFPTSANLDKVNYSDHYPLKVTLEW